MSQATKREDMREKLTRVLECPENFMRSAQATFKQYDKDNTDSLDLEETKKLVSKTMLNLQLPAVDDETLTTLFHRYDFSQDGTLSFEEFHKMYFYLLCRIRDRYYAERLLKVNKLNFIRSQKGSLINFSQYYTIERHIGSGQYGVVNLVRDLKTNAARACKQIEKSKLDVPVEQIQAEVDILKKLDHPAVIKIYDILEDTQYMYLIMEYCRGDDLARRLKMSLKNKRKFAESYVCAIMKQVLSALAYIHWQRVIHKDFKCENIMFLTSDDNSGQSGLNEYPVVKIIDFGLSEMFAPPVGDEPPNELLICRNAAGTPLFMAPEVFKRRFNFKCDVWSAGVVMYLMLTLSYPFYDNTLPGVQHLVSNTEPNYAEQCQGISSEGIDVIRALLTKDPTKRPRADEILKMPWFTKFEEVTPATEDISSKDVDRMKSFMKQGQLKQAVTNMFVHSSTMSAKRMKQLQGIFEACDTDKSGTLSITELTTALRKATVPVWDAARIIDAMDADGNKWVSYTEFAAALFQWEELELSELWGQFQRMDLNGDGTISINEFFEVLLGKEGHQQLVTRRSDFDEMVKEIDTNNDSMISWTEFVEFIRKK